MCNECVEAYFYCYIRCYYIQSFRVVLFEEQSRLAGRCDPAQVTCWFQLNLAACISSSSGIVYLRVPFLLQRQFDIEKSSGLQLHTELLTATP